MKKRMKMLGIVILAAGIWSGCASGSSGEGPDQTGLSSDGEELPAQAYVTLGEYKGLTVSVAAKGSVDEAEQESLVQNVFRGSVTAQNGGILNRAVEDGDTVSLDYEGKKDGVAFDGGTAAGSLLTIGSGTFIPGFEDGLVGVMPGETVDLDLTFPEDYSAADLAGQAVVFTVTVNYIMPQLTDEAVASFGEETYATVEQLRRYVYDYLEEEAQAAYSSDVENAVLTAFVQNCTFEEIPETFLARYEEMLRENVSGTAAQYGVDADTYLGYFYGATLDEFVAAYAIEAAKQDLAIQALAEAEGLGVGDEELERRLAEEAQAAGFETVEEYVGGESKEDYRDYLVARQVIAYLVENATITES
ncbi:MAG: trigger factor [Clostridium sp.]|jgi:trigger factor|nr:trigger factor [Clostridium sp.]